MVGYANGEIVAWNLRDGRRLMGARVHGPAVHLRYRAGQLNAVSELGSALSRDWSAMEMDECSLMRALWSKVAVQWIQGRPVLKSPPADGTCSAR